MKLIKFATSMVIGLSVLTSSWLVSNIFASNGNNNNGNKITICHATSSNSNSYIVNAPNANGDVSGHDGHDGPIWPATNSSGDWGDIIPPFSYNDHGQTAQYPGKNWTTQGQAIWNNGCQIPGSTRPSPSPSLNPSPSVSPSASVTSNPSASVVASASPSVSAVVSSSPALSSLPSASVSPSPAVSSSPSTSPIASSSTAASNQPQGGTQGGDSSSSINSSTGEVLGATTLAATGTTQDLMTVLLGMGILLILGSSLKYAQEKA